MKKYLAPLSFLLLISTFLSLWLNPSWTPLLAVLTLLLNLGMATYFIFERHKGQDNSRLKITKELLIFVITLLLIVFLGGLVGLFANHYISPRFGGTVGLLSALAASFVLGYGIKKGIGKLSQ